MKRAPEEDAILAAVASMPFGGLVHVRLADRTGGPVTLARVAEYLTALAAVLADHSERCQREHAEFVQLCSDVEATRRLLGTGAKP